MKLVNVVMAILLTLVPVAGQAQTKVWNNIVTGYVNVPIMSVTKVSFYDDRTEVFFHMDVPQRKTGDVVPLATKPTLRADGKAYAVKGSTVISLTEPYKIPADGKVDFSLIYRANKIMLHFLHFLHFLHLNRLGGCCIRPRYWA